KVDARGKGGSWPVRFRHGAILLPGAGRGTPVAARFSLLLGFPANVRTTTAQGLCRTRPLRDHRLLGSDGLAARSRHSSDRPKVAGVIPLHTRSDVGATA